MIGDSAPQLVAADAKRPLLEPKLVAADAMRSPLECADGMRAKAEITSGPAGEFKINVEAHTQYKYDYTFLDDDSDKGVFAVEKSYLADRFREYGRCVVVM